MPAPHRLAKLQPLGLRGPEKNVGWLKPRRILFWAFGSDAVGRTRGAAVVIGIGHGLRLGGS